MLVTGENVMDGGIVGFSLRRRVAKDADHELLGNGIAVDVWADFGTVEGSSEGGCEDDIVSSAPEIQGDDAFGDFVSEGFEETVGIEDEVRDMTDLGDRLLVLLFLVADFYVSRMCVSLPRSSRYHSQSVASTALPARTWFHLGSRQTLCAKH
jgi:hypothetical protein